jgi:formate--tetrahydrofolate ligase
MGFEKACNIKAQASGKAPDCAVIVATLRGLKANSGQPLSNNLFDQNSAALNAGFDNLKWHIANVAKYGVPAVVAINRFPQDSDQELEQLKALVEALPFTVEFAVCDAFSKGGEGATELAIKVIDQCQSPPSFKPLYQCSQSLEEKIMTVAKVGYGAASVTLSDKVKQQLCKYKALGFDELAICMAKTPMSISADGRLKGAPSYFDVPVRELKLCAGAGFVYALCGEVMTMPGLPDKPTFMKLDLDEDGQIIGLS